MFGMAFCVSCQCQNFIRALWRCIDWICGLVLINNFSEISNNKIQSLDRSLLALCYLMIFIFKTIFYIASLINLLCYGTYLSIKARVCQLWLLFIPSAILACVIASGQTLTNPLNFVILVIHIASICNESMNLDCFPFNVTFQYIVSIMFGNDLVLIFIEMNNYRPKQHSKNFDIKNSHWRNYLIFLLLFICAIIILITISLKTLPLVSHQSVKHDAISRFINKYGTRTVKNVKSIENMKNMKNNKNNKNKNKNITQNTEKNTQKNVKNSKNIRNGIIVENTHTATSAASITGTSTGITTYSNSNWSSLTPQPKSNTNRLKLNPNSPLQYEELASPVKMKKKNRLRTLLTTAHDGMYVYIQTF